MQSVGWSGGAYSFGFLVFDVDGVNVLWDHLSVNWLSYCARVREG
jgi:hypothetical protein